MACVECGGRSNCPCCANGQEEAEARQEAEELRLFRRDVRRGICGHADCNARRLPTADYCGAHETWRDNIARRAS